LEPSINSTNNRNNTGSPDLMGAQRKKQLNRRKKQESVDITGFRLKGGVSPLTVVLYLLTGIQSGD
jgi:hypothetical protein